MRFWKSKPTSEPRGRQRRPATEQQSPPIFSYYARRSTNADPNATTSRRGSLTGEKDAPKTSVLRMVSQRFGLFILLGVICVCVVKVFLLSTSAKIVPLTASSDELFLQPTTVYQAAAQKAFASSLFNTNKLTVQTATVSKQLKQDFPELDDVSVSLPLIGNRPIVYIQPTAPALILTTRANNAYVLGENGRAILSASQVGNIERFHLPLLHDQSGITIRLSDQALPEADVSFIQVVLKQLQTKGITVSSLVLPPPGDELDVYPTGTSYFVKFNLHQTNARQQAGTFLAVRAHLLTGQTTPKEYIDVRVSGRAYYK